MPCVRPTHNLPQSGWLRYYQYDIFVRKRAIIKGKKVKKEEEEEEEEEEETGR